MGWLVYELTSSAFLAAVFAAARMGPQLLGPFAGVLADRMSRQKIMIGVRLLQMLFAAILAILISTGVVQFWHLVLIGFLQGVINSATMTAGSALAMDIVGEKDLTNAIALNTVAWDVTSAIGPAVGGVLVAFVGPANCFWIAVGLAALAAGSLLPLRTPTRTTIAEQKSAWQGLAEGFKYVIHSRDLLSVLVISFTANLFVWPAFQSFMPVFAKDNLNQGALGLGFLMTAMGSGALVGAVIIASLGNFKWRGPMYLYGTWLYGVFFGIFAISHSLTPALVLVGLAGLCSSAFGAMQSTLTLVLSPEEMRGRSIGFLSMAIGVLPFGCLALGAIASKIGAGLTTGISCGILSIAIIAIAIGMPNLRRLR